MSCRFFTAKDNMAFERVIDYALERHPTRILGYWVEQVNQPDRMRSCGFGSDRVSVEELSRLWRRYNGFSGKNEQKVNDALRM